METAQVGEKGKFGETARDVVGGIARRRIGRRARRAVHGRVKAFERGTRFGYLLRENPRRALFAIFGLGVGLGAIAVTLSQIGQEYAEELEEGLEETPETESVAA